MFPKKTEIPKFTRNIVSEWVKLREKKRQSSSPYALQIAFLLFQINSKCFKKYLHRWQGQLGFYFLIFLLHDEKEVQFFIFWGSIAQIFGAQIDKVSVPWFVAFGFLLYSLQRVLRLYLGRLVSFRMSPIIAGEKL